MRDILWRLAASLLLFASIEAVVFHSGLYLAIIEPSSSAGSVETLVRNERGRVLHNRNQVLAVGDSRMGILPRLANERNVGYRFASIALGGTTPRAWYYMLRDTDPTARRYAAVAIPFNDYDVPDVPDVLEERILDLNYLVGRLRVTDLAEFAGSYGKPPNRWTAFRGVLLRGMVYQRDFQEFLLHPAARLALVKLVSQDHGDWAYNFVPENHSLEGLRVDWAAKKIEYPPGLSESQRHAIADVLLRPDTPQTGASAAYYRYWLGRILEHYRDSGTKLIFLRLPRAPVIRPNPPTPLPDSPVRALASHPAVVLLDEHRFDELERPELFGDALHLNGEGILRFSRILAEEARRVLGPPGEAHAL